MKIEPHISEIAWNPKTLVWDGDDLLDITTWQRANRDGSLTRPLFSLAYPFNGAVAIRHNDHLWAVAYEKRGTKAVLLKDGKIQRELNRSFYCAKAYEYPIALCIAPTGNVVLIHCPNEFNLLEIEDVETGERIASTTTQLMEFHSRLTVAPDQRFVIDAGWFWHPWCGIWVFDIVEALNNPNIFGQKAVFADATDVGGYEVDSACFIDSERFVVSSSAENLGSEDRSSQSLGPKQLGVWSIREHRWLSRVNLDELTGPMMAWRDYVVTFCEHPKLIDVNTGEILYRWAQISSGKQVGAVSLDDPASPPIATDSQNGRFAVTGSTGVSVVSLSTL